MADARSILVLARANWLKSNTPKATKGKQPVGRKLYNDILRDVAVAGEDLLEMYQLLLEAMFPDDGADVHMDL